MKTLKKITVVTKTKSSCVPGAGAGASATLGGGQDGEGGDLLVFHCFFWNSVWFVNSLNRELILTKMKINILLHVNFRMTLKINKKQNR